MTQTTNNLTRFDARESLPKHRFKTLDSRLRSNVTLLTCSRYNCLLRKVLISVVYLSTHKVVTVRYLASMTWSWGLC